ncbi:MAG: hypothetical protein JNJ73_10155 [Hyphomonadaceae bacterium]|nr:hypothetical protein [Hyphomonadaceae bacterium]
MAIPYRADQVGSLLRPSALIEARAGWEAGRKTLAELRAAEDAAILHALALQKRTGIGVLSDGEFRRSTWGNGFLDRLEGLTEDVEGVVQGGRWQGNNAALATETLPRKKVVVGKVRVKAPFTGEEARFLAEHAGAPYKITMPSPTMFLRLFVPGRSDAVYESEDALLDDFVKIYLDEVDSLLQLGVPYIQLDSLRYISFITEIERGADRAEMQRVVERTVQADNRIMARAKQPGVTRAMHICRGNHRSAWFGAGSYESVAEALFGAADVDRFLLEFDDERSGGFEPLRFVPKGKVVVLGLITSKTGSLESLDALRRRVDQAAKFVPLENLAISPQCGFASTHLGNLLTEDEELKKLELVAEAARKIWG